MTCPNCGKEGSHFAPPSMGEEGFYICDSIVRNGYSEVVDESSSEAESVMTAAQLAFLAGRCSPTKTPLYVYGDKPASRKQQRSNKKKNKASKVSRRNNRRK